MRLLAIGGILIGVILVLMVTLVLFAYEERRASLFEVRPARPSPRRESSPPRPAPVCPDAPKSTRCPEWRAPRYRNDPRFPPRVDDLKIVHRIEPRYPEAAMESRISATAFLLVGVRRDGSVGGVCTVNDAPCGLGAAAEEAVKQWKFEPPLHRGEAADVVTHIFLTIDPPPVRHPLP